LIPKSQHIKAGKTSKHLKYLLEKSTKYMPIIISPSSRSKIKNLSSSAIEGCTRKTAQPRNGKLYERATSSSME
jgi:hypothetical protein